MQYRIVRLAKGNGSYREIAIPSKEDRLRLRGLLPELERILDRLDKQRANYAFQRNRNCAQMALRHVGYRYTLSMDLKDFFESVTSAHVQRVVPNAILQQCLIDGRAKQGLPTSPIISTIAFLPVDMRISAALDKLRLGAVYTRYADDLVFSFDDHKVAGRIQTAVRQIVSECGFRVNERKTRLQDARNGRTVITGISVDRHGLHATRRTKKRLRAAVHQENQDSLAGLAEWAKCKLPGIQCAARAVDHPQSHSPSPK